jgi:hypothetical protein
MCEEHKSHARHRRLILRVGEQHFKTVIYTGGLSLSFSFYFPKIFVNMLPGFGDGEEFAVWRNFGYDTKTYTCVKLMRKGQRKYL